jgi:hypothetical protein
MQQTSTLTSDGQPPQQQLRSPSLRGTGTAGSGGGGGRRGLSAAVSEEDATEGSGHNTSKQTSMANNERDARSQRIQHAHKQPQGTQPVTESSAVATRDDDDPFSSEFIKQAVNKFFPCKSSP